MKIGIRLPTREAFVDQAFLVEWARRADAAGFSSLAVTDRVVHHAREPLIALAVAAAATTRVRLCAAAIVVPTRETTLLARQAASLDALSGGRFTLGVGIGVRTDDYAATETDFHGRGRRVAPPAGKRRRLPELPAPGGVPGDRQEPRLVDRVAEARPATLLGDEPVEQSAHAQIGRAHV